jgi:2-oxoglutarate dehydrogenase E2 component (dihydrolipoamide succinyltransferase)
MSVEVRIPAVGESISSGVVSVWHRKSGDFVKTGEPLFTLETDKVSTEIVAEKDGLLTTNVPEGQEVKIGEVVATIDDSAAAPAMETPQTVKTDQAQVSPVSETKSLHADVLSPAVRRIVTEENLDPGKLKGTGKGGRLTKADVLAAAEDRVSRQVTIPDGGDGRSEQEEISPREGERFTRRKMSPLRRKIAAQLVMAQHTAAILTTFNDCDMSAVQELRTKSQEAFKEKNGVRLGFMSFFVKAVVEGLKMVPPINGRIEGDDFIQNHFYDIGVAVGTDRGLVVAVLRDADRKSFAELERDIAGYAMKAREGKIRIEDLQGGTFTISNGGVYGSLLGTPILNPPQSGILGMHAIRERPVAINGAVVIRPMMYLALSYDHRAIDGKEAATFLVRIKECIEDPNKLPLDF